MLYLILGSLMLFNIDQVNYYYFTTESCPPCRRQFPIILKLQEEGFNFEILDDPDSFENFKINVFPTIIIELIDYKKQKVEQIRLVGFQSFDKLKKLFLKIEGNNHGQKEKEMDGQSSQTTIRFNQES